MVVSRRGFVALLAALPFVPRLCLQAAPLYKKGDILICSLNGGMTVQVFSDPIKVTSKVLGGPVHEGYYYALQRILPPSHGTIIMPLVYEKCLSRPRCGFAIFDGPFVKVNI